jgi:hypothetical protein
MRVDTDVDWAYQNQLREQWLKDNPNSEYIGWMSIWSTRRLTCGYVILIWQVRYALVALALKAKNPKSSAFGIPQILGLKELSPIKQIDKGLKYIEHRYDTPCNALKHHKIKGWY